MNRNAPAFISQNIIRRIPATAFDPPKIDVSVVISESGIAIGSSHNGIVDGAEITWQQIWNIFVTPPEKQILSQRQREVYEWIRDFLFTYKYSPNLRQIADGIGLKTQSATAKLINKLIAAGYLKSVGSKQHRLLELP